MDRRSFLQHGARAALAFGAFGVLEACRTRGGEANAAATPFAALRDRYFVQVLKFNPVTSTYLGGDGYSSELADSGTWLRDYTPAGLERERAFYREISAQRDAIRPETLPERDRIDHAVLGAQLAFILHQLDDLRYHERSVDTYVAEPFRGVDWQIQQMTDLGSGRLGTPEEWGRVVARVSAVPAYLEAARENLLAGKRSGNLPDWRMVHRDGIDGSRENARYFTETLPGQARGYGATNVADLERAGGEAARAYTGFAEFLDSNLGADRQDRYAAGTKEYEWRLRNNFREERSAGELYDYGADQVALYKGKIYEVARQVADEAGLKLPWGTAAEKNASVRAVMDYLGKDAPANDDELFRWYRETGERAVAYGRERQLFDIPADYRLDVVPTPPVLRSTIDAAYYPAPPFKKSGVGRFYLTPTGNDPAALRLNNRASVADTAIHEGFPGHDWNFKFLTEHADEVSNIRWLTPGAVEDSASMWGDSMAAEGWGLYSEELMSEPAPGRPYGFYSPAEYLYELQGQLLRAVRVRVDVGLHTGRMSYDQAVDYFTDNVSFFPNARTLAASDAGARAVNDGAQRAIYRYSKWPTQALAYNLGKNAILALREKTRRKLGADYSQKEFHERFMKMGMIAPGFFAATF